MGSSHNYETTLFYSILCIRLWWISYANRWLTHEQTDNLSLQCHDIQLVEGDVEERHETVETLKYNSLDNQSFVPPLNCPGHIKHYRFYSAWFLLDWKHL